MRCDEVSKGACTLEALATKGKAAATAAYIRVLFFIIQSLKFGAINAFSVNTEQRLDSVNQIRIEQKTPIHHRG